MAAYIVDRYLSILVFLWGCAFLGKCESFSLSQSKWDFRGHPIHYEISNHADGKLTPSDPILLLNGFGVGSFHQHRLVRCLMEDHSVEQNIYCVDYLGQGNSWPKDCEDGSSENERGLAYSADLWIEQLASFIEEVIIPAHDGVKGDQKTKTKVHVVGNSVGGHLAAHLARCRPDLVESIVLLNPTPVWGLNLPGWDGRLPAPALPKRIGRYLFDRIRDLNTIEKYLENAYANKAYDEELMHNIRGCTTGTGGHAAFASILWSPPLLIEGNKGDFQDCLARVECDVLLVFGRDDPWCRPGFGKLMLQALAQRLDGNVAHRFIELGNVGHCPNHEAPQAVAQTINHWTGASDRKSVDLVPEDSVVVNEPWGDVTARERNIDDIPLSMMDKLATMFV